VANGHLYAALEHACPFDMVYERYSLWSFAGMEYARTQGIPGLLEVNSPLVEEQAEHRGLVNRERAEGVAAQVFGAATSLLAVSDEVAAYLETFQEARGRVHIVPNGVDPDRFPQGLAPSCPAAPGVFTVGFVGTLKPWHGLPDLVEAFHLLHRRQTTDDRRQISDLVVRRPSSVVHADASLRLLVVGDGPQREGLEAGLKARGLSSAARLTGAVDPAQVPGLLASMDVAVAPYSSASVYFSPLKVYEYMAAGLPVVAARAGQLAGLIDDGANGLLYEPGDTAALAAALDRLRLDPDLRARLGRAARDTVLQGHTWRAVAQRILSLAPLAALEL
jgi:glycosyltransferase involved in cell wall biosynthesis